MAAGGLSHRFGIAQDEHLVEIVPTLQTSCWRSHMEAASWQLSDRRAQARAAYEVSMHLVAVLAVLLGSQSAGAVLLPD